MYCTLNIRILYVWKGFKNINISYRQRKVFWDIGKGAHVEKEMLFIKDGKIHCTVVRVLYEIMNIVSREKSCEV
jgi:hypothetical protein